MGEGNEYNDSKEKAHKIKSRILTKHKNALRNIHVKSKDIPLDTFDNKDCSDEEFKIFLKNEEKLYFSLKLIEGKGIDDYSQQFFRIKYTLFNGTFSDYFSKEIDSQGYYPFRKSLNKILQYKRKDHILIREVEEYFEKWIDGQVRTYVLNEKEENLWEKLE